jgi:TM2 domain-containing membrane protein YozV
MKKLKGNCCYRISFISVILIFSFNISSFSQLHSPENRRLFGDHLFCSGDYLRGITEYEIYLQNYSNDTVLFKVILSLSALGRFNEAEERINNLSRDFLFFENSHQIKFKNFLLLNQYSRLREEYLLYEPNDYLMKLRNFSFLYSGDDSLPSRPYLTLPFDEEEKNDILSLYEMRLNLPGKNPWKAGFFSALLPGAGKIYTEEYSDALFSFITTGLSAYLAYTNFRADHKFRGYLFSAIAAWFYGGNIYGSAASAVIYNARIQFSFTSYLDDYLKKVNYFIPFYEFCR